MELALIVPQLTWKDIFSALLLSAIYSCGSYAGFSNEILPKTHQAFATVLTFQDSFPKIINFCLRRKRAE